MPSVNELFARLSDVIHPTKNTHKLTTKINKPVIKKLKGGVGKIWTHLLPILVEAGHIESTDDVQVLQFEETFYECMGRFISHLIQRELGTQADIAERRDSLFITALEECSRVLGHVFGKLSFSDHPPVDMHGIQFSWRDILQSMRCNSIFTHVDRTIWQNVGAGCSFDVTYEDDAQGAHEHQRSHGGGVSFLSPVKFAVHLAIYNTLASAMVTMFLLFLVTIKNVQNDETFESGIMKRALEIELLRKSNNLVNWDTSVERKRLVKDAVDTCIHGSGFADAFQILGHGATDVETSSNQPRRIEVDKDVCVVHLSRLGDFGYITEQLALSRIAKIDPSILLNPVCYKHEIDRYVNEYERTIGQSARDRVNLHITLAGMRTHVMSYAPLTYIQPTLCKKLLGGALWGWMTYSGLWRIRDIPHHHLKSLFSYSGTVDGHYIYLEGATIDAILTCYVHSLYPTTEMIVRDWHAHCDAHGQERGAKCSAQSWELFFRQYRFNTATAIRILKTHASSFVMYNTACRVAPKVEESVLTLHRQISQDAQSDISSLLNTTRLTLLNTTR